MKIVYVALVAAACQADPKPLIEPRDSWACNLDSDCMLDHSCDCDTCVARNRTVHVQICGGPVCEANPCGGKHAVCVEHRCKAVD